MQTLGLKKILFFNVFIGVFLAFMAWQSVQLPSSSVSHKKESILGVSIQEDGLDTPIWSGVATFSAERNSLTIDSNDLILGNLYAEQLLRIRWIEKDSSHYLSVKEPCLGGEMCSKGEIFFLNNISAIFGASGKIPLELYEVSLYN